SQQRPLEALGLEEGLHELAVAEYELGQWPSLAGELLRVLQGAFEDKPGHRIDVHGGHVAPEPHRLQGYRPATCERIEHFGRAAAVGLADLLSEPVEVGPGFPPPVQDAPNSLFLAYLDGPAADLLLLDLLDHRPSHATQDVLALLGIACVRQQRSDERC